MMNNSLKTNFLSRLQGKYREPLKLIRTSFLLLSKNEISRLRVVSFFQLVLALLDFLGVLAFGLIGTLSVYGIQSRSPDGRLIAFLEFFGLAHLNSQQQVAAIGLGACLVLVSKTLLSAYINKRTINFLANRSANISSRLIEKLAFSNLQQIKKRTRMENIFAITNGVQNVTLGLIGTLMGLVADLVLIIVMFLGLMLLDISIALTTVLFFGTMALILHRMVNVQISDLATHETELHIRNSQLLYELFGSYREIFALGVRRFYTKNIANTQKQLSRISANLAYIPSLPKYVLEISFVIGTIIFVGIQFAIKDAAGAISSVSIFVASSGRIIPAVLRIQGAALRFRGALYGARKTLDVIEELKDYEVVKQLNENRESQRKKLTMNVQFSEVDFSYRDSSKKILSKINLEIESGEWLGVIGPSGAGKSTLIDVLLGIHKPSSGNVTISGMEPELYITNYPGVVAYVPQETFFMQGTLTENIALGSNKDDISYQRIVSILKLIGMPEFAFELKHGRDFEIKELGSNLSGGQRQRLAIARALYSKPKLLILDEVTSALDALSEKKIVDCISKLKGKITIISIAHKLSTITNADRVIFMEKGKIVSAGKLSYVSTKFKTLGNNKPIEKLK